MKKFLRIGFFSVALSQCLYGVNATQWWELDKANNPQPQPPANPTITDPLTIYEDSTLNITTTTNPTAGSQYFNGSVNFDHNLTINLTTQGQATNQTTMIYRLNGEGMKDFNGVGSLTLSIDSQGMYAKSIFNFDNANSGLNLNVKTTITATEGSQIFSIFRNGGSTININNDFIVDLSKATGTLNDANANEGITGAKTIFDTAGTTNVNTGGNAKIQLTGDIANFGGTTTINLTNTDSFFKGRVEAVNTSTTNFNLQGGSSAEINLTSHNRNNGSPNFILTLSGDSIAKITTGIKSQAAQLNFSVNHSSLYADFNYLADNLPAQGNITINNEGTWFLGQSNTINLLTINNPQANLTKDNFEHLRNLASVDFRYRDQGATARTTTTLDEATRYTLSTTQILGENGVFRLFGVFNRDGWTKLTDQATNTLTETIATDQIITNQLFNTHYIQLFWNANNFDKSLLNTNLEDDKIIVAKQTTMAGGNDFIGAITPIGVYNYITNLKKEIYNGANGAPEGWQWIVSNVQRADNSYLSRLLDSLFQSQFRIEKTQIDTLNLRMGELRKLDRVHSVWIRTKYGRLGSKETDQTIGSWDEYASLWLGYDQNFYVLGGKNFFGGSFDVQFFNAYGLPSEDDTSNPSYTGKSQSYGFSIYDTYFFDFGFYIDALAKYYFTHNRFTIASEVLAGNIPDFFTHNFLASLEIGQRFSLPLNFYIKPDAGISFAFNSGQDWTFKDWSNQNIKARLDFNTPINLRTGLTAGWTFNSRGYEGDLYIGTSFEYDFNTGGDLRLEDFLDKMTLSHAGNFNWRINAGTNIILNEYWRIYFDIDTAFFGTINSTFTLNGGVRINFGRLHPQMPYIPPRFEAPEDFRKYPAYRRTIPEVQNYETQNILDNYKGMTKIRKLPPKIEVKNKPYNQDTTPKAESLQQFSITPQVQKQPQGEPVFIDNPQEINAPSKNYKREQNVPISPTVIPQNNRSMQEIKENLNRGFQ
ncbi:autotransporter outer membrane beta-barrel domain-containing protein [Helicobacter brantae]|uniref:Autotransporter domain-containing protein n=1 Tax=Helicobacter brantae TaxID=375927 RepID=A0A3D8J3M5_9HELI|nr:autotransporter outer membrane beta-barrel domain-containing protein [Helicobacter brantae]RDU72079.1 hypothetical protein CQA58_00295 [Helicobacter brantae]